MGHFIKHKPLISEECPDSDGASEEGKLFCVHLVVLRLYLLDQVDFYGESHNLRNSTKDMKITHIWMQTKFNFIFAFYYWFSILKKFHCTIFQFLTHFGIWLGRGWMGYNRHSSPLSSRKLILDGFSFPFKWIGYYIYVPYKISRWYTSIIILW